MTTARQKYLRHGYRRIGGWLFPYSARFIDTLIDLQLEAGIGGAVGEIGVHHGKLFVLLALGRRPGEAAFAIDVFGDQHLNTDASGAGDRAVFLENAHHWLGDAAAQVDVIQRSSLEVTPDEVLQRNGAVRILSVDGGHTEDCVINDLELAQALLARRGVVILDDHFNEFWPGVSSGVGRYLQNPRAELRPFAITPNKTYFAKSEDTGFYRHRLRRLAGYYYEKSASFYGSELDIYGTQSYTFSLKKRAIESIRNTPLEPWARMARDFGRRLAR